MKNFSTTVIEFIVKHLPLSKEIVMKKRVYVFVTILISIIFSITTQVYSAETSRTPRVPTSSKQIVSPRVKHGIKLPGGATKPVLTDRPDLEVVQIRIMAQYRFVGAELPFSVTVMNVGQVVSAATSVNLVVRGGPQSQNSPVYTATLPLGPLNPKAMNTVNVNIILENAIPGLGNAKATVDPQNTVLEGNEQNNIRNIGFAIDPG